VNVAWVFFRAKEWDDAIKVLGSMFSLDNIVLSGTFSERLHFLSAYGVTFSTWLDHINGTFETILWIFIAFIFILAFKNSIEKAKEFELNYKTIFLVAICLICGILSLNKISQFLYFNF
jgi:alginate O-acetyltransferase complex protein AlgI